MTHKCSRCGEELGRGKEVKDKARYIESHDMETETEREQIIALRHTDKTRQIRDILVDEQGLNVVQANRVMARKDKSYLDKIDKSFTESDFKQEEVSNPVSPEEDPEVVQVDTKLITEKEAEKALVCKQECVKEQDEIIW